MREAVNDAYEQMVNGLITVKEASKIIIECIFRYPNKFGLLYMEEDEKSEFILFLFMRMENIIKNYVKDLSTFSTYITNVAKSLSKSWFREYYHQSAKQISLKYYIKNEGESLISEQSEVYDSLTYSRKSITKTEYTDSEIFSILVLALKASYFLTPKHIEILSQKTGYDQETLYGYKEYIEQKIQKKIERNKLLMNRLNSSYLNKNCCDFELMCLEKNTSLACRLEKKKKSYTHTWQQYRKRVQNSSTVKPSNNLIASVLNVSPNAVIKVLRNYKKKYELLEVK